MGDGRRIEHSLLVLELEEVERELRRNNYRDNFRRACNILDEVTGDDRKWLEMEAKRRRDCFRRTYGEP